MTRILMMILSMTFLGASCRVQTKLICGEVKSSEVKALPMCDVSFQFDRCRCRCLDFNTFSNVPDLQCGENFKSGNFDLEVCEGIGGFFLEDIAVEIKPNIKRLNIIKEDYCE